MGEFAANHVFDECPHHALVVHALVLEVLGVFSGKQCLNHDLGDLLVGHRRAMGAAKLAEQFAVAVEHLDDLVGMVVTDALQAGQVRVAAVVVENAGQSGNRGDRQKHRYRKQEQYQAQARGLAAFS